METFELTQPVITPPDTSPPAFDEQKFYPSGAIAFFVVLVALGLIIWFGIYFLMLSRT
jgi:hypothetical protein